MCAFQWGPNGPRRGLKAPNVAMVLAICHMCADYHSGQWSRGYRLLCRAMMYLDRHGLPLPLDVPIARHTAYQQMVKRYKDLL